jgi:hypothetical protein
MTGGIGHRTVGHFKDEADADAFIRHLYIYNTRHCAFCQYINA